jgi:uncharacterized membrane protein
MEEKALRVEEENDTSIIWATPMLLFLVGFFLMLAGIVVLMVAAMFQGNLSLSGAGVIFIGPIPIILGAGPHALWAIVLALVLTVIGFIMFFLLRKQVFRERVE